MPTHRIALIHAVTAAVEPVREAFRKLWPEAQIMNLLDDSLAVDSEAAGALTPNLAERIKQLARYARTAHSDGILYTCSAFGEAIEAVEKEQNIPVLKPNAAMFEAALSTGKRVGMLATFAPSIASMEQEFAEMAARRGESATIRSYLVPGARDALKAGNAEEHEELIAQAAETMADCDALMLAHFSMAQAESKVRTRTRMPVLTAPTSAVLKLRSILKGEIGSGL
jgi:Asp/Glu/hydantoin racemase